MAIKFNCPSCKKPLLVKDEMAGKRAKCPRCQKPITIPTPKPKAEPEPAPTPTAADLEAEAAAALADEPPPEQAPPEEMATITFDCPFCDEKIEVSSALAGKQEPCPCRRIVKVPEPVRTERKDWRTANKKLPSGARRETEPAPEGAWGSATSTGRVSNQALVEAEAIPVVRERVTVRQWIVRGFGVTAALVLIGVGVWGALRMRAQRQESGALDKALEFVAGKDKKSKLPADGTAVVFRGAGEFYLRANKLDDASKNLRKSRAEAAMVTADTVVHDGLLVDLALLQADLGGSKDNVMQGFRMTWPDTQKELEQTLQNLGVAGGRADAMRQLARKLIAKDQGPVAVTLAYMLGANKESSELLGVVGVELVKAGKQQAALDAANQAMAPSGSKPAASKGPAETKPPVAPAAPPAASTPFAPSLVVLLYALGQEARAPQVGELPPLGKEADGDIRSGYAQAYAFQGHWDDAKKQTEAIVGVEPRLRALVGVADIALEKNPTLAKDNLEAAAKLIAGELKNRPQTRSDVLRWVRLAPQAGLADDRIQQVVGVLSDDLQARAQLELVRFRLSKLNQADLDALDKAAHAKPADGAVLEELARHNARYGAAAAEMKAIAAWDPETLRPFGYVGVALGVQDTGK